MDLYALLEAEVRSRLPEGTCPQCGEDKFEVYADLAGIVVPGDPTPEGEIKIKKVRGILCVNCGKWID